VSIVQNLNPSVIPTSRFPSRRWYATKGRLWYYHSPRKEVKIPSSVSFSETLDPLLEDLVLFLHLRRIPTTPSCSGHFRDEGHFRSIWERLQTEQDKIQSGGLPVYDVESGIQVLFKNTDYSLPWKNFDAFYAQAGTNQSHGYLGVWIQDRTLQGRLSRLLTEPAELGSSFLIAPGSDSGPYLFELRINEPNLESQTREWVIWTRRIKDAFLSIYRADDVVAS